MVFSATRPKGNLKGSSVRMPIGRVQQYSSTLNSTLDLKKACGPSPVPYGVWHTCVSVITVLTSHSRRDDSRSPNCTPTFPCHRLANLRGYSAVSLLTCYSWSTELAMLWLLLAAPSPVRSVASAGLAPAGRDELQNAVEWLHKGGKVRIGDSMLSCVWVVRTRPRGTVCRRARSCIG